MNKHTLVSALAALSLAGTITLGAVSPAGAQTTATTATTTTTVALPTSTVNLIDQLKNTKSLTTLAAAVEAAGLTSTLQSGGPFTIFAPDNVAFDLVGPNALAELLKPQNKARLASLLGVHVVAGRLSSGDLTRPASARLKSINGENLDIVRRGTRLSVNNATVLQADLVASNAVIHIIDTVLSAPVSTPSNIVDQAKASGLTTFVAAVEAAGLTSTLQGAGPYTIFVPDNVAFELLGAGAAANLLTPASKPALVSRLQLHVVSGRYTVADIAKLKVDVKNLGGSTMSFSSRGTRTTVGKAAIVKADIETANGIIHIIDTVL
jgi:transforming growth factor-beta-induced protein